MRQSIAPIIAAVIQRIESTIPRTYPDITYSAPRGSLGSADAAAWIGDVNRRTRDFVLYTSSLPSYATPSAPCLYAQEITVAIVYRADIPDDIRDIMMSEDVESLTDAITQHPETWGGADAIYASEPPSIESIEDVEGAVQIFVLMLPLIVITH